MLKKIFIFSYIFIGSFCYSQPRFVTTIHPFKEILQSVVGERGSIHALLPPGTSPHTYEMRPSDMRELESATALFYGAPNLDSWALKFQSIRTIEFVELIPESLKIHFHGQAYHHGEKSEPGHESDIDPHFWTDPLTVKALLPNLLQSLISIDPAGADTYRKNVNRFDAHLDSLNLKIQRLLAPIKTRTVMLSQPFFQYYFRRYNFTVAGIIEKSPGKEPTPREIKGLIDRVHADNVAAICTQPQLPERSAKLVAESTHTKIVALDPLGGVDNRQTYDDILLYNTRKLLEALQ